MKKQLLPLVKIAIQMLVFAAFLGFGKSSAQCVSYFQSHYNGATDEVDFTQLCTFDTSVHPVIFMWDFGDGNGITEENPSHHYAAGSNYIVCLILYVGNGPGCCQDTFCEQIDVIPTSVPKHQEWISEISIHAVQKNISLSLTSTKAQTLGVSLVSITGISYPVRLPSAILAGRNEIDFSMSDYPAGIYLVKIEDDAGHFIAKRFVLN